MPSLQISPKEIGLYKMNMKQTFISILLTVLCLIPVYQVAQAEEAAETKEPSMKVTISVNGNTYSAVLEENDTARAFAEILPATLDMRELNGNEKYHYLMSDLPSDPKHIGTIQEGDLMLFGGNCVVLFYKSFSTSYNYTRIGHLESTEGLRDALGRGDVSVVFDLSTETDNGTND